MRSTLALLALLAISPAALAADTAVAFPEGYRDWTRVKSMVIHGKGHPLYGEFAGMHHVYANPTALAALRAGTLPYPDGSSFAFDLLASQDEGGAWIEGERKLLGVMVKDAARYPDTGGWGFERFEHGNEQSRVVKDAKAQCFQCHLPQREHDYVFSRWHP